jgi:hypothetical protein
MTWPTDRMAILTRTSTQRPGQELLEGLVDATARVDGGGIGQWWRAAQREDELVAQDQAFLQVGLHRVHASLSGLAYTVESSDEQVIGAVFERVQQRTMARRSNASPTSIRWRSCPRSCDTRPYGGDGGAPAPPAI